MILIITHRADFTADFVIDKLNKRKIPFFRLNCEDIPNTVHIDLSNSNNFFPTINDFSDFKSIWFRRTKLPDAELSNIDIKTYYLSELTYFQKNLWQLLDGKWLSHPDSIYRAENKILQLKIASQIGFSIPPTIVSSDSKDIRAFYYSCNKNVIIKPLFNNRFFSKDGSRMLYTSLVKEEDLNYLDNSLPLPSIFQQYISKKEEIRITVVGKKVFSAKVNSQAYSETTIDWRKKKIPFEACEIPLHIEQKCLILLDKLALSFGAIDMIRTPDGEYIFLEINPNGQWAWIEVDTGMPISDHIIDFFIH